VKSNALAVTLALVGVACLVIAGLYAEGILQILVSDSHAAHHYTHTVLFVVLAVASFIAANFTREKAV
jgi:hypothetical protein